MSEHTTVVEWRRGAGEAFLDRRYSRRHTAVFDGGATVALSASPHVVRVPFADPAAVDPEELFVTALASCHMLWFLSLAAEAGFCVDSYRDAATGVLGPDAAGREVITTVTLRPHCRFSGQRIPNAEQLTALHERAHEACFLANSVRSEIRIEPVF